LTAWEVYAIIVLWKGEVMKGKPKIGIDIDGCIAYMLEGIRLEARKRFGIDFDLCDVKEFSLYPQGMTREQINDIILDPAFLMRLPRIYYAREALSILYRDYEIHLVSARREEVKRPTEDWVHVNYMYHDELKIGHDCKFRYAKKAGLKIFVEDRYRNAIKLAEYCDTVFMINKTYNLGRPVPENIIRVEGWHDILEYLYADE